MKNKKLNLKIGAVIFDMDGVITNTMPDHYRAWKMVLRKEGIAVTHYEVYSREGQKGLPSLLEIYAARKIPIRLHDAKIILQKKEALFKRIVKIRYIPGSKSLLRFLQHRGFKLALVTGTARHELQRILSRKIRQRFDVIVTGTDVNNGKPHPEPYLRALKRLGVKAKQAVAIENAPCGILSARRAGLRCLAVTTSLPKTYLTGAYKIFPSLNEIRANIEFIPTMSINKVRP
jgi:beta-phosphoglucomutase